VWYDVFQVWRGIVKNKKLTIDGPAGRNEVSEKYRDHYDMVFRNSTTLYHCGRKVIETLAGGGVRTFPKKSSLYRHKIEDGGNHAE
jgi:hypothetical protein